MTHFCPKAMQEVFPYLQPCVGLMKVVSVGEARLEAIPVKASWRRKVACAQRSRQSMDVSRPL